MMGGAVPDLTPRAKQRHRLRADSHIVLAPCRKGNRSQVVQLGPGLPVKRRVGVATRDRSVGEGCWLTSCSRPQLHLDEGIGAVSEREVRSEA